MNRKTLLIVILAVFAAAAAWSGVPGQSAPAQTERVDKAIRALQELMSLEKPEERLPGKLLGKAQGIAIFPGVVKAAWGIGGQYGRGIISVKTGEGSWSDPIFLTLVGGSVGWQIGVQKSDIILVFKSRKNIESILSGKLTLGADAAIAAGPVGRQAEASTDWEMEAEIYSYSKSKGLFAGVSIKGGTLKFDEEDNIAFYGPEGAAASHILAGSLSRVPDIVKSLKAVLETAVSR